MNSSFFSPLLSLYSLMIVVSPALTNFYKANLFSRGIVFLWVNSKDIWC
jgi:hypothetical protein